MADACGKVAEMIPWVLNGTACVPEQAAVYGHTAACASCRRDLARAFALQHEARCRVSALPAMPADGWARLSREIAGQATLDSTWVLRKLLPTMEAMGLPGIVSQTIRGTLALARGEVTVRGMGVLVPSQETG